MTAAAERPDSPDEHARLFRIPNYRRWFLADTAEAVGIGVRSFAVPLVAVALAGPAAAGIMAGTIDALSLIGMMVGGLLADRYARRRVVLATAPITLVIWGTVAVTAALGNLSFPLLFVLACAAVVAAAIGMSSGEAILRNIVPAEKYPRALSLNAGRSAAIEIGSGPVGGILLAISTAVPFAVNAIATAIKIVGITRIRLDETPGTPESPRARGLTTLVREALAGVAWMLGKPLPRTMAIAAILLNLGFQVILQTLVFDYQQQGVSTALIGLISAGMGAGVLVGSLISGRVVEGLPSGRVLPVAFAWLFATASLLTATDSVYASATILFFTGLALPALNAMSFGFLVVAAPADHQGRVFSGYNLLGMAALPFGLAAGGIALDTWGRLPTMLAALIPLVAAAIWVAFSRQVRRLPPSGSWNAFVENEPGLGE